jgi:hypothetical protein
VSRIEWNKPGERFFEAGVSNGVFYPRLGAGVPWNGLTAVNESSTGGEPEPLFFDGVKYLDLVSSEDFSAVLEAYSSPREFAVCDGTKQISPGLFATQQPRKTFGLSYRTLIGNDLVGEEFGYKIHLVYNITASPSQRQYATIADNINPDKRQWNLSTVPPPASTFKPTAHLVLDSTLIDPLMMEQIETALYGRDADGDRPAVSPYLPTVAQILAIMSTTITEFITATI